MSRVAKKPVVIPKGAEVKLANGSIDVKGPKGNLSMAIHSSVNVSENDGQLSFTLHDGIQENQMKFAATMRALVSNMVKGVTEGFQKKLLLEGTGYRAKVAGDGLDLTLGFSHPVIFPIPEGISIDCPSQKEIVVSGIDKQKVGQTAANIIKYRPEEPYKGKGVIDPDNRVKRKEVKKK